MKNEVKKDNAIIVFIKNPVPGRVKTRLAASVGDKAALEIYLQMIACLKKALSGSTMPVYVFYSDFIDTEDSWPVNQCIKVVQSGIDLGDKMSRAIKKVSAKHDNVILVGSDCPGLDYTIMQNAMHALSLSDLVIGPAADGGYYLIGMNSHRDFLFRDVAWSTGDVFNATFKKAEENGLHVYSLPVLRDVDDENDFLFYAEQGKLALPVNL